jgi:hypothetical protein
MESWMSRFTLLGVQSRQMDQHGWIVDLVPTGSEGVLGNQSGEQFVMFGMPHMILGTYHEWLPQSITSVHPWYK